MDEQDMPDTNYERIYLQVRDIEGNLVDPSFGDLTWCADQINDTDIEYVRADLFAALRAQNEQLIAALKEIASAPSYTSSQQDISDAVYHIADKARAALENLKRDEK